jgi:hypothetical protein
MKKAVAILIPAAFFAAAMWAIVRGIEPMVSQENNNRIHAMLLNCTYMGKSKDFETVLYFDCDGRIELHKEIEWNTHR